MKNLFRVLTICFIITFASFQIVTPVPASADNKISQTSPQMLGTPEEDLSALNSPKGKKSKVGIWVGAILGVALVAALVGGGGGGGGGGDSDGGDDDGGDDGSIVVEW